MTADGKFKVVSLFSGAMGLDLGLEKTGRFELLACVEKVPAFCDTIRLNRDNGLLREDLKVFQGDISDLDPKEVMEAIGLAPGELDLLVGGPPCQAFSTAGKRGTLQDPRGTLLWQFLRFVEVLQPKFFIMENVRGLVSAALRHRPIAQRPPKGPELEADEQPGSVIRLFSEDLQSLPDARYHMDVFEVNSVNYGAPQIRERVLFVGNRFGAQVDFPDPTHVGQSELAKQPQQETLFSDDAQPALRPWRTLRDAIFDLEESSMEVLDFSPRKKSFLEMVPPGANWRSLPEDVQKDSMGKAWFAKGGRSGWWRRLTYDLPCPTLVTMPNHASTSLCHPHETRALSVREYARIQEFPDAWQFSGKVSQKYTQIGNAVPVRLGQIAGEVVSNELVKLREGGWTPRKIAPESFRIVYIKSHVRTRQWYKNGEAFVWSENDDNKAGYKSMKTSRKSKAITAS